MYLFVLLLNVALIDFPVQQDVNLMSQSIMLRSLKLINKPENFYKNFYKLFCSQDGMDGMGKTLTKLKLARPNSSKLRFYKKTIQFIERCGLYLNRTKSNLNH